MTVVPHLVPFRSALDVRAALPAVQAHLTAGRVMAYPTETIYGLGGAVTPDAVRALVDLKGRPEGKPFLLLISGRPMLDQLQLEITAIAERLMDRHWPGPLTLVLRGGQATLPPEVCGAGGAVAVRWTSHPALANVIASFGAPLTSTSANRPGASPERTPADIAAQWGDAYASGVLMVLDGGALPPASPSTVVDCTGTRARILRAGRLSAQVLRDSVPDLIGDA